MAEPYLKDCCLVGGTALALQYNHRSSVDLNVFGDVPDNDAALQDILENFGQVQGQMTSKYIKSFIIDKVKVDWNDIKSFISQKVREIDWKKYCFYFFSASSACLTVPRSPLMKAMTKASLKPKLRTSFCRATASALLVKRPEV